MATDPSPDDERRELSSEEWEEELRWWELDLRSLALVRIVLGLFVLLTLASTLGDLTTFFSDAGVLPRDVLVRSPFGNMWLSFHMGSGGLPTQVVLHCLLAAFATGLIAGWRTPWMVLGCWVLLNSLQARNPFICDRGDSELVLILFWCFFLPLGARWSLDARAGRRPFGKAQGIAAAALVTQFGLIYLFAAYLKSGPFWLGRGDGLEHSLLSPLFGTGLSWGLASLAKPLLPALNYAVVAGELFVALLLLSPWSVSLARMVGVGLLVVFHVLVGLFFQLGLFPWLGATLPLALLPADFWEGWGSRWAAALDKVWGPESVDESPPSLAWDRARKAFLLFCLALAVLSNVLSTPIGKGLPVPRFLTGTADALRLTQHWELFSPIPPYYGWFELAALDPQGSPITLFAGPPTRESPDLTPFPSHRWRMLMIASLYPDFSLVRAGIARELATRAGKKDIQNERLGYRFQVRLPNEKGELQDPVEWSLWLVQPVPNAVSPISDQNGQDHHGHQHSPSRMETTP